LGVSVIEIMCGWNYVVFRLSVIRVRCYFDYVWLWSRL